MQLAALHLCRECRVVRLQLLQSSDISAVGCPNKVGEHVHVSEDPRDNILKASPRVAPGCVRAAQYPPGMSPCLLKQTGGLLDASVGGSILEGLDEIDRNRLKLPASLRPSGRLHQRNHPSRRKLN